MGNNPTLYGYVGDCNTQIDPLGLDTFGVNQDVYALYNKVDIVNGIPKKGAKLFLYWNKPKFRYTFRTTYEQW